VAFGLQAARNLSGGGLALRVLGVGQQLPDSLASHFGGLLALASTGAVLTICLGPRLGGAPSRGVGFGFLTPIRGRLFARRDVPHRQRHLEVTALPVDVPCDLALPLGLQIAVMPAE